MLCNVGDTLEPNPWRESISHFYRPFDTERGDPFGPFIIVKVKLQLTCIAAIRE